MDKCPCHKSHYRLLLDVCTELRANGMWWGICFQRSMENFTLSSLSSGKGFHKSKLWPLRKILVQVWPFPCPSFEFQTDTSSFSPALCWIGSPMGRLTGAWSDSGLTAWEEREIPPSSTLREILPVWQVKSGSPELPVTCPKMNVQR